MFSNSKKTNPPAAAKQQPPSILSAGLTVNGDLNSEGEMQIDCLVNGDVTAGRLAIGENAKVIGEVVAEHVLIRGEVVGRIRAKSVELDKSAKVRGDIWHELLSIAAGAKIEGLCKFAENPREGAGTTKLSVVQLPEAVDAPADKPAQKPHKTSQTAAATDIGSLPGLARATS
ncbi:polymer-forming cytoskeletal protein [Ferrovibrio terrae]|jgi:cytoskeletal protein CcmA (bactofilin family)|uniref:bactofilin family protein n=1 Tax=Ferrovibrio terrae TaxID=2594003 RepID=UPI003137FAF7